MHCVTTQVGVDGQRRFSAMEGRSVDRHRSRAYAWTRRGFLGLTAGATLVPTGGRWGWQPTSPAPLTDAVFNYGHPKPPQSVAGVFRYGVLSAPAH